VGLFLQQDKILEAEIINICAIATDARRSCARCEVFTCCFGLAIWNLPDRGFANGLSALASAFTIANYTSGIAQIIETVLAPHLIFFTFIMLKH